MLLLYTALVRQVQILTVYFDYKTEEGIKQALVAQWLERRSYKAVVVSSILTEGTYTGVKMVSTGCGSISCIDWLIGWPV